MSTCCPEFRSALVTARRLDRRARLDAFQGFGDASEASATLAALEGAADPLPRTEPEARWSLENRFAKRARAKRLAARASR
jgi:hypothetical protein